MASSSSLRDGPCPETPLSEAQRCRMISDITQALHSRQIPAEAKQAALTLIGWLARRMPQDRVSRRRRPTR